MIEKMKVVHIVAAASEKTALLDRLRALGIVHFGEKASADQRHLERFALACVRAGKEPADVLAGLALSGKILICEDISCGVVPMDAAERAWRERHGALLQQLSRRSETVIRIFCGLPQQLKP